MTVRFLVHPLVLVTAGLAVVLGLAAGPSLHRHATDAQPAGQPSLVLELGRVELGRDFEIEVGESHEFTLDLGLGEAVSLRVEQAGADVVLVLIDPGGTERIEMDRPLGGQGVERLTVVAEVAGRHRIRVEADWTRGAYRWIARDGPRPARQADRDAAEAEREFMAARKLERVGEADRARAGYVRAEALFEAAADRHGIALAAYRRGCTLDGLHRPAAAPEAERAFRVAYPGLVAFGESLWAADTAWQLGRLAQERDDLSEAAVRYRDALAQATAAGSTSDRTRALAGLGWCAIERQDLDLAASLLLEARALAAGESSQDEATVQLFLSDLYFEAGDPELARSWAQAALDRFAGAGGAFEGAAWTRLGRADHALRRHSEAVDALSRAIDLFAAAGLARHVADCRFERGLARLGEGRLYEAQADFAGARRAHSNLNSGRRAALAQVHLAWTHELLGQPDQALALAESALASLRARGDLAGEAAAYHAIARALVGKGDLDAALASIEKAIAALDQRRAKFADPLRASEHIGRKADRFALWIDILSRLAVLRQSVSDQAVAFAASERVRAQALASLMTERGAGLRLDAGTPETQEQVAARDALTARLHELDRSARRAEPSSIERLAAERELAVLLARDEQLEAEIRAADPRFRKVAAPEIPTLSRVQRELLDDETRLLVYSLGPDRSWLWSIDRERAVPFALPARDRIEESARQVAEKVAVAVSGAAEESAREALADLAEQVLSPAAKVLDRKRIVVVADGALHLVPFSALPLPDSSDEEPLGSRHEVVYLPSLTVLAELRSESRQTTVSRRILAVVGDPVSSADDPRLAGVEVETGSEASTDLGLVDGAIRFGRLPQAAKEVVAVASLVPASERLVALGFDANLDAVLSGELAGSRYVHFAVHGVFNERFPALSGLVLSRYSPEGRRIAGTLRLHDVYRLELPCEMVVLSACETARGRDVRGEGVVGLTRGFLLAGARRVVVTLWAIDDKASAALIAAFYQGLLNHGMSPAAALAAAQREVRMQPGWKSPYYWAGFILVGDWR